MNGTSTPQNGFGVTLSGSPAAVAAAQAALAASTSPPGGCNGSCGPGTAAAANAASLTPVVVDVMGGALAAQSQCLTTGQAVKMCPPGTFPAYTAQAPLFVTKTPTRKEFDVPCAVAVTFFGEVAIRCRSTDSVIGTVTIGQPGSGCGGTQITAEAIGSTADVVIAAQPGCEEFTPGLLFTIGFSNDTSPGPVNIDIAFTSSDGCPEAIDGIRVMLAPTGIGVAAGTLAVIFNCVEEQRLYPVLARLRNAVVQIPAGVVLPGGAVPAPGIMFTDETINIHIQGPSGTSITIETLAWKHPTLSCLWNNALAPMGL